MASMVSMSLPFVLVHFVSCSFNSGLIRWGIVLHGFIDGHSRLITGLRASNNNLGDTVLDLFECAISVYGVPSRLRGDHGVENICTAQRIEELRGMRRGSYIWGRYVCIWLAHLCSF